MTRTRVASSNLPKRPTVSEEDTKRDQALAWAGKRLPQIISAFFGDPVWGDDEVAQTLSQFEEGKSSVIDMVETCLKPEKTEMLQAVSESYPESFLGEEWCRNRLRQLLGELMALKVTLPSHPGWQHTQRWMEKIVISKPRYKVGAEDKIIGYVDLHCVVEVPHLRASFSEYEDILCYSSDRTSSRHRGGLFDLQHLLLNPFPKVVIGDSERQHLYIDAFGTISLTKVLENYRRMEEHLLPKRLYVVVSRDARYATQFSQAGIGFVQHPVDDNGSV